MPSFRHPQILFHNTNDRSQKVTFQQALMEGQPPDCNSRRGLYMIDRKDVPKLDKSQIIEMKGMSYAEIATTVLTPYLKYEIAPQKIEELMSRAYDPKKINVDIRLLASQAYIMWLTLGPTYSFKDFAALFYGVVLNHFLDINGSRKTILVATSGDTGGALANALHGLENVDVIVFYPKGEISEGQRRQMTTLKGNVYAIAVNGDFDVCQDLVKYLLNDKEFADDVFGDPDRFSSANSISLGRLLPQMVYPFYAHSRIATDMEPFVPSISSGNFGDMMGTVLAREMGLPVSRIICALNENTAFLDYLKTGAYMAKAKVASPSSAMNVGHPSNLARLVDFYGGHMYDEVKNGIVVRKGLIDVEPDIAGMKRDIWAVSVSNEEHYATMKEAYETYGVMLDPHGAVGYNALSNSFSGFELLSVIYETADPGKFPDVVEKAIDRKPPIPEGMQKQTTMEERIYDMISNPDRVEAPGEGVRLNDKQITEAKAHIRCIYAG